MGIDKVGIDEVGIDEVGRYPHHWVKVVENVGFTLCIFRLCQVIQLQRGREDKVFR